MAYFNKFKIGSTSYDVQDAAAGKALDMTPSKTLELLNADGTTVSSVQINVSDLGDTFINNPSNGDVLTYDGYNNVWKNAAGGGGSVCGCKTYHMAVESGGQFYPEAFSTLNPYGQTTFQFVDDINHPTEVIDPTLFYQYITAGAINIEDATGKVSQVYCYDNSAATFSVLFDDTTGTYKVTFTYNGTDWACSVKKALMLQ